MIDTLRQWTDSLFSTDRGSRIDACVECGSVSPPGTNRCADCLGDIASDSGS